MDGMNLAKQLALAWIARERDNAALAQKIERQQRAVQQHYANQANSLAGIGQAQYFSQAQYANAYGQQARVVWAGTNEDVSSTPVQTKAQWVKNLFRSR